MKYYFLSMLLFLQAQFLFAQSDSAMSKGTIKNSGFKAPVIKNTPSEEQEWKEPDYHKFNLGLGLGFDYGGLGAKISCMASKRIFLSGSVGYNFINWNVSGGAGFRLLPDKSFCPYLLAMYGYNAYNMATNADEFYKSYYGPGLGTGLEIGAKNRSFFNIELLVPFRPPSYLEDREKLERMGYSSSQKASPVAVSLAYHFKL